MQLNNLPNEDKWMKNIKGIIETISFPLWELDQRRYRFGFKLYLL